MRSKARRTLRAAAIGGIVAGAMALPATAAHAQPSSCQVTTSSNTVSVYCATGTGEYQAVARCEKPGNPLPTLRYGLWRSPGGQPSTASCLPGEELRNGQIRFR
ncbi:hypothetical protein OUY22_29025 [Nonomuraea sp. MCN248]|uniref:Uncharacterized protein n=1 Tax=Nonomuraea corallina TaxID=2989783 RepID=A0ABT4SJU3_9ACTN|nr:hypothetical protein [Nonomuraea corallina]MDA0637468.1 hypothetical protein [Nonomuraea corallina]